jgi:AcrR family transcriptional regulator
MPRANPARTATPRQRPTTTLSRDRIVAEAVALADEEGLDGVSMRRLAQRLSVDPMSLYNHVGDKDDLLDAMADAVVAEIVPPARTGDWPTDLRATILAARARLLRHPWAVAVISRPGEPRPATLTYMDGIMDILRSGGVSLDLTHHALHVLGSRVMGFSQDLFVDSSADQPDPAAVAAMAAAFAATHPRVAEMVVGVSHDGGLGGCDDDTEFAFALDLILDGLVRRAG